MPRTWFNHVSIHAKDMEESQRFYEELFGAEVIQTPNMNAPVRWLKIGDLQLHFFGTVLPDGGPLIEKIQTYGHFAVGVDDFAAFYRLVQEKGVQEDSTIWGHSLNVLPSGQVQYYVRDPTGNLIEINWNDAENTLPEDILSRADFQAKRYEQTEEQLKAHLYVKETDTVTSGSGE